LASHDPGALRIAIARNILETDDADNGGAVRLATYIVDAASGLAAQDFAALNLGLVQFPELD
jgi:hypothetical protein